MYDSRSDNVAARQGYRIPSLRTWNDDKYGRNDERHPDRIKALTHGDVWASRANSDMGRGDYIDWSTPRSRQLATKRAERAAIAEGLAEYETDRDLDIEEFWAEEFAYDERVMDAWAVECGLMEYDRCHICGEFICFC